MERLRLRVGTRGSALARAQAQWVVDRLAEQMPHLPSSLHVVRTLGDVSPDVELNRLGADGVFTRALEHSLQADEIDIAVHSAKDMPSKLEAAFTLAAITLREDSRDCIVSRFGVAFRELPRGATIGTGSPRRIAQLSALRTDLRFVPLRGNVDTRRDKALHGKVDAVVLAIAGLSRLGLLDHHAVPLDLEDCLPQAGQGALAIEVLTEDTITRGVVQTLDSPESRACVEAERAVWPVFCPLPSLNSSPR